MSAPQVVSVDPQNQETDVVLGAPVVITFDQLMDTTTISDATFSLTRPAPMQVVTSQNLISGSEGPSTTVVRGTFTFATDSQGRTVATFQPAKPLDSLYTLGLSVLTEATSSRVGARERREGWIVCSFCYRKTSESRFGSR